MTVYFLHSGYKRQNFNFMERLYPLIRLLAYNIEVVIDLELLMVRAYNTGIDNTPFSGTHKIPNPSLPGNPSEPDKKTIHVLKCRHHCA